MADRRLAGCRRWGGAEPARRHLPLPVRGRAAGLFLTPPRTMPVPGRKGAIIAGFFTVCLLDTSKTVRIMRKGKMNQEALNLFFHG